MTYVNTEGFELCSLFVLVNLQGLLYNTAFSFQLLSHINVIIFHFPFSLSPTLSHENNDRLVVPSLFLFPPVVLPAMSALPPSLTPGC